MGILPFLIFIRQYQICTPQYTKYTIEDIKGVRKVVINENAYYAIGVIIDHFKELKPYASFDEENLERKLQRIRKHSFRKSNKLDKLSQDFKKIKKAMKGLEKDLNKSLKEFDEE